MRCSPPKIERLYTFRSQFPITIESIKEDHIVKCQHANEGPSADAGHHCPVTDLSSVSPRQRTPNGMGWPGYKTHHDLINQSRFFCQMLIIKETRGRRWPPLPPSVCQSLTADTRGSASRRHTVTTSYRRSCTPSPAPRGNVNKGRLVVSRLTSPCYRQ